MLVAAAEVVADHLLVRLEGVVLAQERRVGRVDVEEVDVLVELLDHVIEAEAADPLLGWRWRARLGTHRPGVEMGLADRRCGVAGVLESAREGVPFGLAVAREVAENAVVVRVPAGEQRRARRLAHGAFGPGLVEPHTLDRKAIEMRRDHDVVAGATHHVGAVLIRIKQQQIRLLVRHSTTPSHEMIPCLSRMPLDL